MQLDNMEEVKLLMLEIENLFMDLDEKKKEIEKIDLGVLNTQSEKNREFKRAINELIDIVKELRSKQ